MGRVQLRDSPIYAPEDSDTAMKAPECTRFSSIVDGSLNPVPLCDLDQVVLKEVMAQNCGLTLFDLKKGSPEHTSATLTGCESHDDDLEPAAVREDADNQLSEIASSISPVDASCVELKQSAFLAQLLLEEVDLESTSEQTSPVGKPVLHMQHTCSGEPAAQSPDTRFGPREAGDGKMRQGATGRRQGGDRKTTGWRQENNRKAAAKRQGSDRKQQAGDRKAIGEVRQEGNREATGRRQGGDRETTEKQQETRHSDRISDRKAKERRQESDRASGDREATGKRQEKATGEQQESDTRATGERQGVFLRQEGNRKATGRRQLSIIQHRTAQHQC